MGLEEMLQGKIAERMEVEGVNTGLRKHLEELRAFAAEQEAENAELKAIMKRLDADNSAVASHLADVEKGIADERGEFVNVCLEVLFVLSSKLLFKSEVFEL